MHRFTVLVLLAWTSLVKGMVQWVWVGALQSDSAKVNVKLRDSGSADLSLELVNLNMSSTTVFKPVKRDTFTQLNIQQYILIDLNPDNFYEFNLNTTSKGRSGSFRTPQKEGTPQNFTFAFASCANNNSNSQIFDHILQEEPLFFIHTGDIHYGNIAQNDLDKFAKMLDSALIQPRQNRLFKSLPVVYMFDDHDFGPNNSDGESPGRDAAVKNYVDSVPAYNSYSRNEATVRKVSELALSLMNVKDHEFERLKIKAENSKKQLGKEGLGSVFQSFTVGRAGFIVTDLRSSRISEELAYEEKTLMGPHQLLWFLSQLLIMKNDDSIVHVFWISTIPWFLVRFFFDFFRVVDDAKWGDFKYEQDLIVKFVERHHITQLTILAGDAHMIAHDDGSHSPGHIPVFHAAPLDKNPSSKGGPYSHGIFPGSSQFGVIHINDNPQTDNMCIHFSGKRMDLEGKLNTILHINTCDPSKSYGGSLYTPSPAYIRKGWKVVKKSVKSVWLQQALPAGLHQRLLALVIHIDQSQFSLAMYLSNTPLAPTLTLMVATLLLARHLL